jgi:hypothetical protein
MCLPPESAVGSEACVSLVAVKVEALLVTADASGSQVAAG